MLDPLINIQIYISNICFFFLKTKYVNESGFKEALFLTNNWYLTGVAEYNLPIPVGKM